MNAKNSPPFDPLRFVAVPPRDAANRDAVARDKRVAEAAYRRAERRGFEPGHELEDWLAAEAEVDGGAGQGDKIL